MAVAESEPAPWRKSTRCGGSATCVEAGPRHGLVVIRDTADRDGPFLTLTPTGWFQLLIKIKEIP
ncbi:DUF397 domain-containing protein [Spirillospora sp. NPDC048911]|uniref:DUF397 domain-containing protein n=1 Tax=Spirillospora sp. NPDC048911 TaxID=3364527 RepID=UPI003724AB73